LPQRKIDAPGKRNQADLPKCKIDLPARKIDVPGKVNQTELSEQQID
jgi:hypothetical protein